MSGPKVYRFGGGSNSKENSMILSALSNGFFSGVSAKVENGSIVVTVQEYASISQAELAKKIQEGKRRYERDVILLNKERNLDLQSIDNKLRSLGETVNAYKRKLSDNKMKLNSLKQKYSMSFDTKYNSYNLDDVLVKVSSKITEYDREANGLDDQADRIKDTLENYKKTINKCSSLDDFYRRKMDVNSLSIDSQIDDDFYNIISNELEFKSKQLMKFTNFVNTVSSEFNNEELKNYEERVKNLILKLNPLSEDSISEISNELKHVKKEIENIRVIERMNKEDSSIRNLILEFNRYIDELLGEIVPVSESAKIYNDISIEITKKNEDLYNEYSNLIKDVEKLKYISNPNKTIIDNIKNVFERSKVYNSRETLDRFTRALNDLKAAYDRCLKDLNNFELFEEAKEKYSDLYDGIVSITTKNPEILVKDLPEPVELIFRYNNSSEQLENLKKLNDSIAEVLKNIQETSIMQSIAQIAQHNEVFSDNRKKGEKKLTYVRKTDKGILFDVKAEDGDVKIYPRAVVLSNGKKTKTKDELNDYYNKCDWADDVDLGFKNVGLSEIQYDELKEEREKMFNEAEYYHCKDEEESIRFLKMSGYSDDEIINFGYSLSNEENEVEEERTTEKASERYRSN